MAATLFSSCRTGSGTQRAAPSQTLRYAPAWTPEPVRGDERGVAALPIPPPASEFIGEFGDDFVEVADEADVGDLEDGGVLILVYGDDGLRILHAGEVLDRDRKSDRDIDFGRDDLARLDRKSVV